MHKRKDLTITTEYFDDHLPALEIPEAYLLDYHHDDEQIVQDNEYYGNSKIATQMQAANQLQKIISKIAVNLFLECWEYLKLKFIPSQPIYQEVSVDKNQIQEPRSRHKRNMIQKQLNNDNFILYLDSEENNNQSGIIRDQNKNFYIESKIKGKAFASIEKKKYSTYKRYAQISSQNKNKNQGFYNSSQKKTSSMSKVKLLKQIVNKLKSVDSSYQNNDLSSIKSNLQLHKKLTRIEKIMGSFEQDHKNQKDMNNFQGIVQKESKIQKKLDKSQQLTQKNRQNQDFMNKFILQMNQIKEQLKIIKKQNHIIVQQQEKYINKYQRQKQIEKLKKYQILQQNRIEQLFEENRLKNLQIQRNFAFQNEQIRKIQLMITNLQQKQTKFIYQENRTQAYPPINSIFSNQKNQDNLLKNSHFISKISGAPFESVRLIPVNQSYQYNNELKAVPTKFANMPFNDSSQKTFILPNNNESIQKLMNRNQEEEIKSAGYCGCFYC